MTTRSPSSARGGHAGRVRRRWLARALRQRPRARCTVCGRFVGRGDATVDHIMPVSRGGFEGPTNYRIACFDCNSRRREVVF